MRFFPRAQQMPSAPCRKPQPSEVSPARRRGAGRLLVLSLVTALCACWLQADDVDAKRKRKRPVEPPLRIVSVTVSPDTYVPGNGSLDFDVEVILPEDTDGSTVLEVSSMISSPSMRELRFLTNRLPIEAHREAMSSEAPSADGSENEESRQVLVTLSWDGTDQYKQLVDGGRYKYVLRAKLLESRGDGLRTWMVSWKKKGVLQVKAPPVTTSESADVEESNDEAPPSDGSSVELERKPDASPP